MEVNVIIFYFLSGYWLWKLINIFYYCKKEKDSEANKSENDRAPQNIHVHHFVTSITALLHNLKRRKYKTNIFSQGEKKKNSIVYLSILLLKDIWVASLGVKILCVCVVCVCMCVCVCVCMSELPRWLSGKESIYQCRRHGFNLWDGRSPGERNGNPLQSCMANPTDRGAWELQSMGSQEWNMT